MRNYRGAAPAAIQDPVTRDAVYAIHSYLEQLNHIIGPKFNTQTTASAAGAKYASQKIGGWDTAETLIASGKIAANPTTTTGDMIFRNASGNLDRLGVINDGAYLKVVAGIPQWAASLNIGGKVFYSPEVFHGHSVGTVGTSPNFCQTITMSQSTKTSFTTTITAPPGFTSGHFVVYFAGGTTADNLVINLYATPLSYGASVIDQAYSVTDKLVCTASVDGFIMVSPDSTNCQGALSSEPVRITVERDPTDGSDTHPDPIEFVGLELHYDAIL